MNKVSRIGILSIACAVGVIAFVIVLVLRTLGTTSDQTKNLQDRFETAPPVSVNDLQGIQDQISTNKDSIQKNSDQIKENAADPYIVVTVMPGTPGANGAQGAPGAVSSTGKPGANGRVVVVQPTQSSRATKAPTSQPSPRPTPCALGGLVRLGTIC